MPNLSLIVSGFFELVPPEFDLLELLEFRIAVLEEEEEGLFDFCLPFWGWSFLDEEAGLLGDFSMALPSRGS